MNIQLQQASRARQLQWIVVAYFVAGVLLSGAFVSAVTVWVAFGHLRDMHEQALSRAVQARRAVIEQYITRVQMTAAQIAGSTPAREQLAAYNRGQVNLAEVAAASKSILDDARHSAAGVLGIVRFDWGRRPIASVGARFADFSLNTALDPGIEIREIASGGELVLVVKTRIADPAGVEQGTDAVVFSLDDLRSLTGAEEVLGVKASVILGRLDGTTPVAIASGEVGQGGSRRIDATLSPAIVQASQGNDGRLLSEQPGVEPTVIAFAPVRGTDWGLAASVSRQDLDAPVWQALGELALWLSGLLSCAMVAAVFVSRSLSAKVLVQAEKWFERLAANEDSRKALERRTSELETILESVDQGIAMFDGSMHVVAANRRYGELMDIPTSLIKPGSDFIDVIRYNAERGEHGDGDVEELMRERVAMWRRFEHHEFERTRPDGTILHIEVQPVTGGGIVVSYSDVTDRRRTEERAAHIGRLLDESLNEIYVFDALSLCFIDVNQGAQKNLGYTMAELRTLTPVDIKPKFSPEQFVAMLEPLRTGAQDRLTFSTIHRRKDGTDYPVEAYVQCSRSEGHDVFVAMILDASERAAAAAARRDSEARYRALYDDNPSMFFTIDSRATIVSVNRFGAEQLGYVPDELTGKPLSELTAGSDPVLERPHIKACLHSLGTVHRDDVRKRHRDGRTIWVRESARAVKNAAGETTILLVCEDVTATRELSEQLKYHAAHDTLTGLPNRREFEVRLDAALESAMSEGCEHALCYLDLDQFKVVNDTCGHTAGDEMLRQIAKLLQGTVRNTDTLARLGGDEFGLLVTHCPLVNAENVADNLRALIEDFHFAWEDKSFRIGVSIGLVPITIHSKSRAAVMSGADAACYAAKNAGRNRVHVFHCDDADVARHRGEMSWIGRIQGALDHDRLRLDVQPIVSLSADDRIDGEHYEVLVRMIDEDGSIISPGQFLPVAERYNLAPRIDRWVISTTLDWLSRHRQHLARLSMCSINLSGISLTEEQFPEFILAAFRYTGVPAGKICFEITETAAIANLTSATRLVTKLRDAGCRFALDDFGSGLSSFGYLKQLPVEFVKIDGMFVKDILEDPIDFQMVRSINEMAHVLGKRTIAEFVENDAILEALREIGVDYAQGYGIGRPQPLADREEPGVPMPVRAVR